VRCQINNVANGDPREVNPVEDVGKFSDELYAHLPTIHSCGDTLTQIRTRPLLFVFLGSNNQVQNSGLVGASN